MNKVVIISILAWIIVVNLGKLYPLSKGEQYYRNLLKWYSLANNSEWGKANIIENKLKEEDVNSFKKENKEEELKKKLNQIMIKKQKTADDWMEIASIRYKLKQNDEIIGAIQSAHELDPIREDISKIYFTFQTSQ